MGKQQGGGAPAQSAPNTSRHSASQAACTAAQKDSKSA